MPRGPAVITRMGIALAAIGIAGCAAAIPRRPAPAPTAPGFTSPMYIVISGLAGRASSIAALIHAAYAPEGVEMPRVPLGDTLLLSRPLQVDSLLVVHRARIDPGTQWFIVYLDAVYQLPGDTTWWGVRDVPGLERRAWQSVLDAGDRLNEARLAQ